MKLSEIPEDYNKVLPKLSLEGDGQLMQELEAVKADTGRMSDEKLSQLSKFLTALTLALLLFGGGDAVAAPAHVQGGSNATASGVSTLAVTLSATVGVGHVIVGTVGCPSVVSCSVADDKSNNYPLLDTVLDTTDSYNVSTFYLLNITNGPITFTVTVSPATSFIALAVDEYSGVAAAAALDGHAINFQPNVISLSADSVTSGNITTAAPGDLIWGATMGSAQGNINASAGTGFTLRQSLSGAAGVSVFTEDLVQGSAGSIAATFTPASANEYWDTGVIALKAATGAPRRSLMHVGQ